jgi:hypothetical protein
VNTRARSPRSPGRSPAAIRPTLLARIALGAFGVWIASIGARAQLRHGPVQNTSVGRWLLGGVLAHDAVIAPAVFVLGALIARWSPARVRQALAAILLIGGSVLIVGWPEVLRKGRGANPTVGPLDYGRNLLIVLVAVICGVVLIATAPSVAARSRRRRAEKASKAREAAARAEAKRAAAADEAASEATAATHTTTPADNPAPQSIIDADADADVDADEVHSPGEDDLPGDSADPHE